MKNLKILILEDNITFQEELKNHIEDIYGESVTIFCATKGEKAVKIFEENSCNVALLDIRVRGMNGIEVADRINGLVKQEDSKNIVPIIFISAYSEEKTNIPNATYPSIFIRKDQPNLNSNVINAIDYFISTNRSKPGKIEEAEYTNYFQGGKNCFIIKPRDSDSKHLIWLKNFRYINSGNSERYLKVHTTLQKEPFEYFGTLKDFMNIVKKQQWKGIVKCQKSFIINVAFVKKFFPRKKDRLIYLNNYVEGFYEKNRFVPVSKNLVESTGKNMTKLYFEDDIIPYSNNFILDVENVLLKLDLD